MVFVDVGLVAFLARSRAMMKIMTISGIAVTEMVGGDSEGNTPLTRTSSTPYAIAAQKSSLTVFKFRFLVES